MSTSPATTKPPPSAAVGRAPKGTSTNEIKGLDDDELDYDDDMENENTGSSPSQPQEPPKDEKPRDSEQHSNPQCCTSGDEGLLNIEVIIILTMRSPEVDPEVNPEADHLMDLAVLLPKVTEFILVTGLVPMTGAKIETTDQIVAHTTVMTKTDIAPVMTGIVMTDTMTSTEADIMTGVMTGDMMTGV